MKKNIFAMLALMAGSMLFTACSDEDKSVNEIAPVSNFKSMTFLAGTESDADTRAVLDGLNVKWASGDAIGIFDGSGNNLFVLTDGAGSTSGTFSGSAADAETYYAAAPYSVVNQLNGSSITGFSIPATQTAVANGVDPSLLIMMGKTTDKSTIKFKNALAYIKVKPTFDCNSITLKSNGSENIAGDVTLTWDSENGLPAATVTGNGAAEISLTGTITAGNTYYIAICPATLVGGFSISFSADDANNSVYTRSTGSNQVVFARNKVIDLGVFATNGTWTSGASNGHNWVQLWADGPKFAECNIGASSPTEYQYEFFRWGETVSRAHDATYDWSDYFDTTDGGTTFTTYKQGGTTELSSTHDAATQNWGSSWRLPTPDEFTAMISNCTCEWTVQDKIKGLLVTGKGAYSSNSIFLLACGGPYPYFDNQAHVGLYMTSSLSNDSEAFCFMFTSEGPNAYFSFSRCYGQSVRPVYIGQ